MEDKLEQLLDRLDRNYEQYQTKWESMSSYELIGISREITAVKDAHYYMSDSHGFEPEELDYLLKFENPLEIVSDKWHERLDDISDISFALGEIFDKQDALRDYPMKEEIAPERPSVLAKLRSKSNLGDKPHVLGKEQEAR